jgi:protein-serine/threonine kinase
MLETIAPTEKRPALRTHLKSYSYQCFAIILEYAGGGELFDFIALGGRFSPNVARTYFYQMMSGLNYMHERGYVHRDIKP